MQRLLLIRHTKTAAFGSTPGDHARPLTARGQAMAHTLGQMLAQAGWLPDHAIVSTALRARQTWDGIAQSAPGARAVFDKSLYLGTPAALLDALGTCGKADRTVALIGHNPGMAHLAQRLVEDGIDHDGKAVRALGGGFKTGWAAAFDIRDTGPALAALFDPRGL